jgi:hypothetical protein
MAGVSTNSVFDAGKAYRKKPVAGEWPLFSLWAICPGDIIGHLSRTPCQVKFGPSSQDETYVVPAVGSKFAPDYGGGQVHA